MSANSTNELRLEGTIEPFVDIRYFFLVVCSLHHIGCVTQTRLEIEAAIIDYFWLFWEHFMQQHTDVSKQYVELMNAAPSSHQLKQSPSVPSIAFQLFSRTRSC